MEDFYTYIYYDPSRNNEPIYVGKGIEDRAWKHLTKRIKHPFIQRLQLMKKNGIKPIIGLYSGLNEEFAHFLEVELIQKFGRKDLGKGSLLNLTDGGEGPSGRRHSEEAKEKMSLAKRGILKGPRPPEVGQKVSASKKGKPGRIPSVEENLKRSATLSGHIVTDETKRKIGLANKGRPSKFKGIPNNEGQK